MIASIPLPDGADPITGPRGLGEGASHSCDVMIGPPADAGADVFDHFLPLLGDAGWHVEEPPAIGRSGPTGDVWRLVADRDWDIYLLEVYVKEGVTQHFFITVTDG